MFKKFFVLTACFVLLNFFWIYAQEVPEKVKQDFLKKLPVIKVEGPNLHPSAFVECCDDVEKPCVKRLQDNGLTPAEKIMLYVYNSGDMDVYRTNGKIEFFDLYSNSKKSFNFVVKNAKANGWAQVFPIYILGPYLVKGEITISVTFKSGKIEKVNTNKVKGCSTIE